jgi:hypothetical protein
MHNLVFATSAKGLLGLQAGKKKEQESDMVNDRPEAVSPPTGTTQTDWIHGEL